MLSEPRAGKGRLRARVRDDGVRFAGEERRPALRRSFGLGPRVGTRGERAIEPLEELRRLAVVPARVDRQRAIEAQLGMAGEETQACLEGCLRRRRAVGAEEGQRGTEQRPGQLAPVGVPLLPFAVQFPGKLDELAQVRLGHVGLAFLQRDP